MPVFTCFKYKLINKNVFIFNTAVYQIIEFTIQNLCTSILCIGMYLLGIKYIFLLEKGEP